MEIKTDNKIDNSKFFIDTNTYKDKLTRLIHGNIRENLEKERTHKYYKIVKNAQRKTSDMLSKYEYTEIISIRANHIQKFGKAYIDIGDETDAIVIAEKELKYKKCPLCITRKINNNMIEIWDVNEMIIPFN